MRTLRSLAAAFALGLPLVVGVAHAQGTDVPALTKLIDTQPAGVDRTAWKEQRREAARKLGQSKDKRAVPVLIKLAETETFDIIGDIAIEGLGNLGDPAAVPVLQKIANDQGRDKETREIAKKSLAKLPAAASTPTTTTTTTPTEPIEPAGDPPIDSTPTEPTEPSGGGLVDTGAPRSADEMPAGPDLPDDTLAASDRLTFAAGTASLAYDTLRKRPSFDADVAGRYAKRIERESMAWGFDAGAHVVTAFVNPEGREQNRGLQVIVDGTGEVRFYHGMVYGVGKVAANVDINNVKYRHEDNADADVSDTRIHGDFQVAIGGGYGRLLDVGSAIRVRRIARTLDAARALGKPIDDATSRKLQLAWWGLRADRSGYNALVATVAILREAGILLSEPDAGLSYELMAVLRDSQLYMRPSGIDIQLAIGEGYLYRPDGMDDDTPFQTETGRVEQLLVSAGYGKQVAEDTAELSGHAYARLRLFADAEADEDPQPTPWAVGATARFRKFAYGEHGDSFGALDLSASLLASQDGCIGDECENPDMGVRLEGEIGFTMFMNQASGLRLAGTVAQDAGNLFIGASLTATYGLLDGVFAR